MPMELLRELATMANQFPVPVIDQADVDKLRILAAAGMVQALLPQEPGQAARLIAITGLGRATLLAQNAREVIAQRAKILPSRPPPSIDF